METTQETKEPKKLTFERTTQPDLKIHYSQERVEPVEFVTLWKGEVGETDCDFKFEDASYVLPNKIAAIYSELVDSLTQGKLFRDDLKARLEELEFDEKSGRLKMKFRQTSYGKSLVTNRSMEVRPAGWQKTIRDSLEPGPKLSELKDSRCSNQAGVNCLVITSDDCLVLQEATQNKMVGAGQLGHSASGSMDFKIPHVTPFEVMQAEIFEELSISQEEASGLKLFAVARDLNNGGKPELFFILKPNLTFEEIRKRRPSDPDKEVKQLIPVRISNLNQSELQDKLNELVAGNTSTSTKAALYYFNKYIT